MNKHVYLNKLTKSHNSCKTCSIGHLHVMLDTVYAYEQNPSRDVGGVAHTRFSPYILYSNKTDKVP